MHFKSSDFTGSNILVLGGYEIEDGSNSRSRKASVLNKQYNCQDITDLPYSVNSAAAGIFENQPVYCGGYGDNFMYFDECLKWTGNDWKQFAKLNSKRSAAAMVPLDHGFWITGGSPEKGDSNLKSTEYVKMSGEVDFEIDLQQEIYSHCMIKTSDSQVFIIGGNAGQSIIVTNTRIYGVAQDKPYYVGDGPSLNVKRHRHGCTTFKSLNDENESTEVALVVGGYNSEAEKTAEIWNFQILGATWKLGNNF